MNSIAQKHPAAIAKLKMRGKPYEFQILAKSISKNRVTYSIDQLIAHNTKYSVAVAKLLKSCVANAVSKGMQCENLHITQLSVGRGSFLKRIKFKGRGRTELRRKPELKAIVKMCAKGGKIGK
jgi:ribosomal protein L22